MAEGLLNLFLSKKQIDSTEWKIASAGCWAIPDIPATTHAIATMEALGWDISNHRSQPLSESLLAHHSLVLCMELAHILFIQRHFSLFANRAFLLYSMIEKEDELVDPIGGSRTKYEKTAREIISITAKGFSKIQQLSESAVLQI